MTDFIEIGLIDLSRFVETRYVDHNFSEVSDKDTNIKYLMIKFSSIIDNFGKSNIIAFSQEVNIHFQLMHPAILKIIGYNLVNFNKSPYPIIITELPTNYTLGNALSLGRSGENNPLLSNIKKLIIIYGIAAGMSFMHSNNIIHRDLKPNNIYLDDNFYPKISNFSLAKKISEDNDQINSELVGTPAYLAPEILISRTYSKKSDVYAFSLILYEIVTNKRPFESCEDVLKLFEEVSVYKTRPEFDNEIPKCYKNLIEKCWSHDPQDRPTFDEILDILKNNHDFINDQDDSEEFHKYIEFINSSKTLFDEKKRAHHLDHIINTRLQFFFSHNNAYFHSIYWTSVEPVNLKSFMFDFSHFERHEKIGEGSFGRVFKIVNKDTGEIYAAKESLRCLDDFSSKRLDRFRAEVELLSDLEFPSITKLIGFNFNNIKNKPKPTFVLEYISNGSLHSILEIERKGEKIDEWNDTKKLINFYGIASAIN